MLSLRARQRSIRSLQARSALPVLLATALLLVFASAAGAQTRASISKLRFWCCTTPDTYVAGAPESMLGNNTHSPFVETGGGAAPQSIMLDASEVLSLSTLLSWCNYGACTAPNLGGFFKYIKGFTTLKNPAAAFVKNGGPSTTLDYCFNGPGVCSPPSTSAGIFQMNGRMVVKPGLNKFGGAMSILSDTIPTVVARWMQISGSPWSRRDFNRTYNGIGHAVPWVRLTQPAPRTIISGPHATVIDSSPNGFIQMNGAGPFQTGTLSISVTMWFDPQLGPTLGIHIKGYDNRTADGAGHIQLVSGQLVNTRAPAVIGSNPKGMRLNLPEPGPSAGLAAAALALLLAGLRRRQR